MKFHIIGPCYQNATYSPDRSKGDFLIEEDNWNDFGFHTTYHLHAGTPLTGGHPEYLGYISIMRTDQESGNGNIVRREVGEDFETLPDDFCSLSMSVELYRGIDRYLKTSNERKTFAEALKMIFSVNDERYRRFHNYECFQKSLLRNATMKAYALQLGREIIFDETSAYDLADIPLTYTLPDTKTSVRFDFSNANATSIKGLDVPARLLACIGDNGVGKSTILYRLARILFTTPSARDRYSEELGSITPKDAGFRRLFLISYSAFDNFTLPGTNTDDYELILTGLKNNNGRLVYCGIRDIISEYEELINDKKNSQAANLQQDQEETTQNTEERTKDTDHSEFHKLKTVSALAKEFSKANDNIRDDKPKRTLWNTLLDECSRANDSFSPFLLDDIPMEQPDSEYIEKVFCGLSTGLKYLLHSLASILDRIEYNSIIIFDEPENHIQPPLLCKFLYCLRILSKQYSSLVLVATHSPVILQETLSKNVIVVSRKGKRWRFRQPSIETYGENIGSITNEIFNLNTSVTNYQHTAEKLFELNPPTESETEKPLYYLQRLRTETGLDFGNEIQSYLISKTIASTM